MISACSPAGDTKASIADTEGQSSTSALLSYAASEWEPSWSLKLTDGTLIAFRRLDTDSGAGFITENYTVIDQTARSTGWIVTAAGDGGTFSFTTADVSGAGGCTHSASGLRHRDDVAVTTPTQLWRGCGGPEI